MIEPRETLQERLANRRRPGDPGYDAFYDASDDVLSAMVPPRPPMRPYLTDQEDRRARIQEAATMMRCPY